MHLTSSFVLLLWKRIVKRKFWISNNLKFFGNFLKMLKNILSPVGLFYISLYYIIFIYISLYYIIFILCYFFLNEFNQEMV